MASCYCYCKSSTISDAAIMMWLITSTAITTTTIKTEYWYQKHNSCPDTVGTVSTAAVVKSTACTRKTNAYHFVNKMYITNYVLA